MTLKFGVWDARDVERDAELLMIRKNGTHFLAQSECIDLPGRS